MGGTKHTKKVITQADVKKDLFNQASANARKLLKEKTGQNLPETAELDDVMRPLAESKFKEEFTIQFETDPLMYKNKHLPDALSDTIVPVAQLCSIEEGSNIDRYIDTVLLSKVDLPAWMAGNARGSLKTLVNTLVSEDTHLQTRSNAYQLSFDGQNEDEDSWRAKAVVVFLTGSLLEHDICAHITIVYFLAIYYKTLSPTKTVRQQVQNSAYTTAKAYTSCNTNISEASQLEDVLKEYADKIFKARFSFDYASLSPPDSDPNATSALNVNNSKLFYFQDLNAGVLNETVQVLFFQGLNIPEKYSTMKGNALKDVVDHFKELLKDVQSGSWSDTFISQTYHPNDPTLNPVRMNAVLVKFYNHMASRNNDPVSCTYLFCLAQIWEVVSPERIAVQDILRMMIIQLQKSLKKPNISGKRDEVRLDELKVTLHEYAKEQFQSEFNFEWKSKSSSPPELARNTDPNKKPRIVAFDVLKHFETFPIDSKEITEWMDVELFRRDDKRFQGYPKEQIYDDIQNDIKYHTSHFPPSSMWGTSSIDRTYNHSSQCARNNSIAINATYVYGLGDMAENGVRKQIPFLYVLMVVYGTPSGSNEDGW